MISNSSPLIFLSKINQLSLLKKLFSYIFISKEVKDEILVEGKMGEIDINNAIKEGWIKVIEAKNIIFLGIKGAEASVINLAIERKDKLIVDDAIAIKVAKSFDIETIRTTTVIFMAVKNKIITKEKAISFVDELIEIGYYISPGYYSAILKKLTT